MCKHMTNCASLADFARNSVLHNLQHWLDKERLTVYGSPIKQKALGGGGEGKVSNLH